MLLDSYYLYRKCDGIKSGYFLEAFTGYYRPLHCHVSKGGSMKGRIVLYKCNPPVKAISQRQPSCTLSGIASARISGLFFSDVENPSYGFGDVQGTSDLLLVIDEGPALTIFVLKGRKNVQRDIIQPWIDGEYSEEISALIGRAVTVGESEK